MTDVANTVKSVERAVASPDKDFSDVYQNIVALQQSSGDMRQFQQAMAQANRELAQRGLNDLNHDGRQDFVLLGAADGFIITGDPSRGVLQARDQHFKVVKEQSAGKPSQGRNAERPDGNPDRNAERPDGNPDRNAERRPRGVPARHVERPSADNSGRPANRAPAGNRGESDESDHAHAHEHAGSPDHNDEAGKVANTPGEKQWGARTFNVKEDGSATYKVKSGDTLWSISQDVLRTQLGREPNNAELIQQIKTIAQASGIANPDLIKADMDVLTIPKPGAEAAPQAARPAQQRRPETQDFRPSTQAERRPPISDNTQNNTSMRGVEVNGYAFPVVGYTGATVPLHHGSAQGGSDLFAPRGTPVVAFKGGTVEYAGNDTIGGYNVMIRQSDGKVAYYAHLDQPPSVRTGQTVQTGQQIGVVGDTGNAKGTGPHLHFGVGNSIINGTGPSGGVGSGFNAVALLNQVLVNTRQQGRA